MTNFVLCIHVQIRFASTEKNYSHRLACILLIFCLLLGTPTSCSRVHYGDPSIPGSLTTGVFI